MKKTFLALGIVVLASVILGGGIFLWAYTSGRIDLSGLFSKQPQEVILEEEEVVAQIEEDDFSEPEPEEVLPEKITVCFTGDVEISSYVQANYDEAGVDGVLSPEMQEILRSADITMVNNEFCYSLRGEQALDKMYTFRVDPSYVNLLTDMGVDVAGLANNHVLDFGKDALLDTFSTLEDAGIEYTGAGVDIEDASKLVVKEVAGKKIGFLAASRVIPVGSWNVEYSAPGVFTCYDYSKFVEATRLAKEECDYVFVMVHWGVEHTDELTDYQVAMGHALVDAGADGVIGMHSHCLQPVEYYNGVPIFYSLGNFIFNRSIASTAAVEIEIDLTDEGKTNDVTAKLVPASAKEALTFALEKDEKQAVINYVNSISPTVIVDEEGVISLAQ